MIKVVAKNCVLEGRLDDAIALYKELIEKTTKEKGCIKYELFQDINDPRILTMIEEWENKEALNAHEVSEHFIRIFPLLKEITEKDSDFRIYERLL
ncbi:MAG: putative quinol monooxygenase [Firmicutes bacterium]|nr:putative quinol monooxygenase [Bacillota bacterium]